MVEAGSPPARPIAMPRLSVVALILSLALNAFIAGGFFYSRLEAGRHPPGAPQQQQLGPERKLEALAQQLGIDPESSRPVKEMRRSFRAAQMVMAAKNRSLGEVYWEELTGPQPDQKHLQELVDQMSANRHEFQTEVTGVLVRFMATLTAEQRQQLLKIVEDRNNPLGGPVRNGVGN